MQRIYEENEYTTICSKGGGNTIENDVSHIWPNVDSTWLGCFFKVGLFRLG